MFKYILFNSARYSDKSVYDHLTMYCVTHDGLGYDLRYRPKARDLNQLPSFSSDICFYLSSFFSSHDIPSITAYSQQIVRKNTPRHPEHHCLHLYHCGSDRRLLVPRCSWNSPSAIGPFLDRLDPASSGLLAGTDYTAVLGCFANWRKNDISVILLMALGRNTVQSHGAILNDVSTLKLV